MSPARRASGMDQEAQLAAIDERVRQLREQATSANTWRAYHSDFTRWSRWAIEHQVPALPARPQDLARYLEQAADPAAAGGEQEAGAPRAVSPATVTRWVSSIRWVHRHTGHPDPTTDPAIQEVLVGLGRDAPRRPRSAPPLGVSQVERILAAMDASPTCGQALAEVRDRALILLAFTTGLRSAELIALRVEDLEAAPSGLTVHVSRNGQGGDVAVRDVAVPHADRPPLDPTLALETWLRRLRAALATHPDPAGAMPDHPRATATKPSANEQFRALLTELTGPVFRSITRYGRLGAQGRPEAPPDTPLGHNAVRQITARRCRDAGL